MGKSFFFNLWTRFSTPNRSSGAFFKSLKAKLLYSSRVQ